MPRQLKATPLRAGFYAARGEGGWIRLDWEEWDGHQVGRTVWHKRTIQVSRPRALQAMKNLDAHKTVV